VARRRGVGNSGGRRHKASSGLGTVVRRDCGQDRTRPGRRVARSEL